MSETIYRKVGRRYVSVAESDPCFYSAVPYGTHLVTVEKGSRATWMQVKPDEAALVAVIQRRYGEMCDAVSKLRTEGASTASIVDVLRLVIERKEKGDE